MANLLNIRSNIFALQSTLQTFYVRTDRKLDDLLQQMQFNEKRQLILENGLESILDGEQRNRMDINATKWSNGRMKNSHGLGTSRLSTVEVAIFMTGSEEGSSTTVVSSANTNSNQSESKRKTATESDGDCSGRESDSYTSLLGYSNVQQSQELLACDVYSKTYTSKNTPKESLTVQSKPLEFTCFYCEFRYDTERDLALHVRYHTGVFPHICNECGKAYASQKVFQKHVVTHERPYLCSPILPTQGPWDCTVCKKNFYSLAFLRRHYKRIHSLNRNSV